MQLQSLPSRGAAAPSASHIHGPTHHSFIGSFMEFYYTYKKEIETHDSLILSFYSFILCLHRKACYHDRPTAFEACSLLAC